jgi:hypothetical protein
MPSENLSSVGFFHFGQGYDKPILMLELAIGDFKLRGGNLENALIVLPEGFNIGRSYYGKERPSTDWSILGALATLCHENKCVFVAGAIVDEGSNVHPPYSSAYLVDGDH